MPFLAAHCATGWVSCGSVCDTRTTYGERVVITDVAAFMITIGFFASVAIGVTASALGVSPKPARISTLSRVTSSCARRLAMSGAAPVVSRVMISTFLPPKTSPFCFRYAFIPPTICAP